MTTVALFHSVLGVRRGVLDAADRLRGEGHEILLVDLYDGRTFDDYPPAMTFAHEEIGMAALTGASLRAVAELPDGFVNAGFSLGCVMAAYVATKRPVSGVLTIAGAIRDPRLRLRRRRQLASRRPGPDALDARRPLA